MKKLLPYAKTAISAAITALYAIQSALSDGHITQTEWLGIAAGVLTTLGVFFVPNAGQTPKAPANVTNNFITTPDTTGSVN